MSCTQGASKVNMKPAEPDQTAWTRPRQVVYAPACVTRMMGPSRTDDQRESVHEKLLSLFEKANYQVIYPEVSRSRAPSNVGRSRSLDGSFSICLVQVFLYGSCWRSSADGVWQVPF